MATENEVPPEWVGGYHYSNGSSQSDELEQLMLGISGNMSPSESDMLEYREHLLYYLMGIGGSIVCCLGTIANALSVAVLTRRSMRSSTYAYLAALAICDSLALFLILLIIINDTRPPDSQEQTDQIRSLLFPFVHPSAVVFQVTSIWLTLAFTVDRYIMICHPFKAERMCRRSRAIKVIVFLYAAGLVFNIPRYLEYRTKIDTFPMANSSQIYTVYGIEATPLGNSVLFRELVHSWLYLLFICAIPFFTLVILNAFLIRAVHLSRLKGKEINPREKHRNNTTIMLIGVIVIFLICQGPALVSRIMYAFRPVSVTTKAGFTLNEVGNFFVLLNSAINIVPYYLFGRKFRSEFWRLFCVCCFDRDELRRIIRSYSFSVDQRRTSQYDVIEMNGAAQNKQNSNSNDTNGGNQAIVQLPNHIHYSQVPGNISCGKTASILQNISPENVSTPLIHKTGSSLSLNGLINKGISKDSVRTFGSLLSPSTQLVPTNHAITTTTASKQGKYMTVTAGPCVRDPQCSAV